MYVTVYIFHNPRALVLWTYASLHGGTRVFQVAVLTLTMRCFIQGYMSRLMFLPVNILEVYADGG